MSKRIYIGSRESRLAVVQSEQVMAWIKEHHPELDVQLLTMKTTGDRILDRRLDKIGGKGLFVKELDKALSEGRSDLSVHSLKDMPMEIPKELPIVAFSAREDPRDVLVLPEGVRELDLSKPIGCSSLRRMLQLKKLYPGATFANIRGNVLTRLEKVDSGEYAATVLAAAGLGRLGLLHRASRYFTVEEMLPAAGQGILAVQGREREDYGYLEGFEDRDAALAGRSERAFVRALDGGCTSPVAAYGAVQGGQIFLTGLYYDEETENWARGTLAGDVARTEALGQELAEKLRRQAGEEKKSPGKVFLVGAGPGDAELLTVKGKQVIDEADVIVYDSLVGDGVLGMIPDTVRTVNVGKRSGHHIKSQYETNRILLEEAEAGQRVVRLKGGDPFLFGRGGEELELLAANHIPFEVVPGVTSALAVPAYNGIPVTHRDYCSSVHIVTGHKKAGEVFTCDFEALVRTGGTLVFLMGMSALEDICNGLVNAGMDPDMPAAVLQQGTTAGQRRAVATVSTLKEEALRRDMGTPAIIVVGRVCALSEKFAWYEKLPLQGMKVAVTRPRDLISQMAAKLRALGAEVLEMPAISTERIENNEALKKAIASLGDYQWIAFTSPTGVKVFFEELKEAGKDIRALGKVRIASIGRGTSRELERMGIFADLMPEIYDGAHLGQAMAGRCEWRARILIPRAEIGNREIIEELGRRDDLEITDIATYHTLYKTGEILDPKAAFETGDVDLAVFTSASTVRGFAAATEGLDYAKVRAACIGKQTAAEAGGYGMECHVSKAASMDSLVDLIVEIAGERRR
ncbi:MAG TPA: hydroxymethylbilane synthase [Lachnospiraceae bacterium]|nr:hydroxymethylbilane synthase [Lachnospiraceae bacterium]